jgi:hypothetical protein
MFCIYSGDPYGPFNPDYWNSVEEFNTLGKLGARPSFPLHPPAFIAAASTLPADSETKFRAIMCASICRIIAVLFAVDLREAHVDAIAVPSDSFFLFSFGFIQERVLESRSQ